MSKSLPNRDLVNNIAFAVFRVAALINFDRLKIELENAATDFVSELSERHILKLERLIKLGRDIKQISEINSSVLLREINRLSEYLNAAKSIINLTKDELDLSKESAFQECGQIMRSNNAVKSNVATNNREIGRVNHNEVIQYINQSPEFRIKDLRSGLPHITPRTLRRIISGLLKQGKITRIGNPGPASFYRVVKSEQPQVKKAELMPFLMPQHQSNPVNQPPAHQSSQPIRQNKENQQNQSEQSQQIFHLPASHVLPPY